MQQPIIKTLRQDLTQMLMHHNEANGNTDVVIVTIDFFYISDSLLKHLGTANDNEGSHSFTCHLQVQCVLMRETAQFYLPPTGTVRVNEGDCTVLAATARVNEGYHTVLPAIHRYSAC